MSFGLDLNRLCDHKVVQEDKILEDDKVSVILNRPLNNTSDIIVRLNDFRRSENFLTEILMREDVTNQFSISNKDTIVVSAQIYDGLKIGQLATFKDEVTVRINVVDEDVSEQFTGVEDFFIVQGKPLLKSNDYDFTLAHIEDVVVSRNGVSLSFIQTTCANSQPYSLTNASQIGISIAGGPVQLATFNTSDFADITAATAAEIVAVINEDWPGVTAFSQSGKIVIRCGMSFVISDGTGTPNVALGFSIAPIANDGNNAVAEIDATLGRVQLNFVRP